MRQIGEDEDREDPVILRSRYLCGMMALEAE
jgi:hypothetical protein